MPAKSVAKPMRALCGLSLFTLTVMSATASTGQSLPAMERVGFGVALAETTRDACYYAPDVLVTLDKLAVHFSETAPALWDRVMEVSRRNAQAMGNFARSLDPTIDDCQAAGFGICDALVYHVMLLGPNPVVLQEMERLGKRGGRLATEEELQANEILEGDL